VTLEHAEEVYGIILAPDTFEVLKLAPAREKM
jgi:hypothetical protein